MRACGSWRRVSWSYSASRATGTGRRRFPSDIWPDSLPVRSIRALRSAECVYRSGVRFGISLLVEGGHLRGEPALLRDLIGSLVAVATADPEDRGRSSSLMATKVVEPGEGSVYPRLRMVSARRRPRLSKKRGEDVARLHSVGHKRGSGGSRPGKVDQPADGLAGAPGEPGGSRQRACPGPSATPGTPSSPTTRSPTTRRECPNGPAHARRGAPDERKGRGGDACGDRGQRARRCSTRPTPSSRRRRPRRPRRRRCAGRLRARSPGPCQRRATPAAATRGPSRSRRAPPDRGAGASSLVLEARRHRNAAHSLLAR